MATRNVEDIRRKNLEDNQLFLKKLLMNDDNLMATRNVEDIRRKNLEDNQLFLKKLLMNDIRDDFINSARLMLPKKEIIKNSNQDNKIEYVTRYNSKVKSGEIPPHVPEWQRQEEKKLLEKERKKQKNEIKRKKRLLKRRLEKKLDPPKWMLSYKINTSIYQHEFKPRRTKLDERIQQEIIEHSEEK